MSSYTTPLFHTSHTPPLINPAPTSSPYHPYYPDYYPEKGRTTTSIILAALLVCGGVFLLILVLCCLVGCCCHRHRMKAKDKQIQELQETLATRAIPFSNGVTYHSSGIVNNGDNNDDKVINNAGVHQGNNTITAYLTNQRGTNGDELVLVSKQQLQRIQFSASPISLKQP
ncbi:hypothetical protein BCR41DRAFT_393102 [Lobosporangium transversale]|uniref:Uncharacterized protein n=1 Tax=Lobosporangium transversale TaxID=64571 RepID=A0A1Y2H049_9FUNG|nr:hypothetical protein BCR41DRAFT_393102 [Lobosporangium transversale]ORZ27083.1 hypothetical protein BCR41DRAFT_393102 [Lobosporangium transversale]|eukprot:XP_021884830.1 hypothetical protein BCR41DRAFT_393102 [Lobosporangium transversale]